MKFGVNPSLIIDNNEKLMYFDKIHHKQLINCCRLKKNHDCDDNSASIYISMIIIHNKWLRVYKSMCFFEDNLTDILFSDVLNLNSFMNSLFV